MPLAALGSDHQTISLVRRTKKQKNANGSAAQVLLGSFNPLARSGGHVYREPSDGIRMVSICIPSIYFVREPSQNYLTLI
jgi:hypothetical protein